LGDDNAIVRWRNLFWAAGRFNSRAFQGLACAFRQDSRIEPNNKGGTLKAGGEYTKTPAPGPIKSADYILTGEVTGAGDAYKITARIEAACNREVVKTASITTTADLAQVTAAAETLAAQFRPLQDTIAAFEKRKRESNPAIARSNPDGKLTITAKPRVKVGERTPVTVKMTDCDGYPLGNREIRFVQGSWPDLGKMPGTTGGTIEPSSVVTNASGQATVFFKATAAGTAQIAAWYGHYRPTRHPYALLKKSAVAVEPFKPDWTGTFSIRRTRELTSDGPSVGNKNVLSDKTIWGDDSVRFSGFLSQT